MSEAPIPVDEKEMQFAKNLLDSEVPISRALGVPLFEDNLDVWREAHDDAVRNVRLGQSFADNQKKDLAMDRLAGVITVDGDKVVLGPKIKQARADLMRLTDVLANDSQSFEDAMVPGVNKLIESGVDDDVVIAFADYMGRSLINSVGVDALRREGVDGQRKMIRIKPDGSKKESLLLEEATKAENNIVNIFLDYSDEKPEKRVVVSDSSRRVPVAKNNQPAETTRGLYAELTQTVIGQALETSAMSRKLRGRAEEKGTNSLSKILKDK